MIFFKERLIPISYKGLLEAPNDGIDHDDVKPKANGVGSKGYIEGIDLWWWTNDPCFFMNEADVSKVSQDSKQSK